MKTMDVDKREVTLTHHKTSVEKHFVLRPFRPGDEEAVSECVREEYGDTYYRREYYDKELLHEQIDAGKLFLFMAFCGDDICGIQSIISHGPEETRMEAASQIFRKAYRGYGLPYELVKYTYEAAKALGPSCIYASTVVFHSITQKMCEDAGMIPVGFNLGSHLTSKMQNSYSLGSSEKYAQAILILPVKKKEAGEIYIHSDIADTVRKLYEKLNTSVKIISNAPLDPDEQAPEKTILTISVNDREQSISIKIKSIGKDLIDRLREIKSHYSGKYWTIQLILPVDKSLALSAYEKLKDEDFFFTGIRPLCSEKEQIFMQYTGDVYFCFEEYRLTENFRSLLDEILSLK